MSTTPPTEAPPEADGTLSLPDGRTLAWRERGPATGRPVIHLHGSASSRLEPGPSSHVLSRLGLRLVVPDRPGYGGSTARPGRTMRDVATDLGRLADHLGWQGFAACGWSAGAAHALAAAAFLPGRVRAVAVVGAVAPLADPELLAALPAELRRAVDLGRRFPVVMELGFVAAARVLRARPDLSLRWLEARLPEADRRMLAAPAIRSAWLEMVAEAWRSGHHGTWDDGRCLSENWGFRPADVHAPVHVWQGEDDRIVPRAHARWWTSSLPAARFTCLRGAGHAPWPRHSERILAALRDAAWPEAPSGCCPGTTER